MELTDVKSATELEVGAVGPAANNRLWIYTGIAPGKYKIGVTARGGAARADGGAQDIPAF
jgi:hypothetical protein